MNIHAHPAGLSKLNRRTIISAKRAVTTWEKINEPQLTSPSYLVRAKAKLLLGAGGSA